MMKDGPTKPVVIRVTGEATTAERFASERRAAEERRAVQELKKVSFSKCKTHFEELMADVVVPAELSTDAADVLCKVYARSQLCEEGSAQHISEIYPKLWGHSDIAEGFPVWTFFADLQHICSWFNLEGCTYNERCYFKHMCMVCHGDHNIMAQMLSPKGEEAFVCCVMQELSDAGFDVLEEEVYFLSQIKTHSGPSDDTDAGAGAADAGATDDGAAAS